MARFAGVGRVDVRAMPAGRRRAVVTGRAVAGDAIVIEHGADPGRVVWQLWQSLPVGMCAGCLPVAMVPS